METAHLSTRDKHILGQIFQHPASHNLEWHDVILLMEHLGTVQEENNGHLKFTVNDVSQSFHRSRDKDVSEIQEVLDIRHFLETARVERHNEIATEATDAPAKLLLLVVINQEATRIFRTEAADTLPERIHPYDPRHVLHHLNHIKGRDIGARLPENLTYYKAIAETLRDADEVLLMGNGTGASSAMNHLKDFLGTHHKEIADKIVGEVTVDVEALSEGELLEAARSFFLQHNSFDTNRS